MLLAKSKTADGRPLFKLDTTDNFAILPDTHIPFHDPVSLQTYLATVSLHCRGLVIIGDLFDYYSLSDFAKKPSQLARYSIKSEVEVAIKWINHISILFDWVVYMPGNHEQRWDRLRAKNPALAGLDWYWPMKDIIPTHWNMLNVDSRVVLRRQGMRVSIEHGDRASRNSSYVSADKLTALYPNQVTIIGHNHRLAAHHRTHWINNRPVEAHAYSVGHLADVGKLGYVSAPDWQKGGMIITENKFQLLSVKGEKVTWL